MNMFASLKAKAPFLFNGHRKSALICENLPHDYSASEIASIKQEVRANSDKAVEVAQTRNYQLNPRMAAANLK